MKKARNEFVKNLRYLCLVGVIAVGLMTIVGSNGGDGGGGDGQTQPQGPIEQDVRNMSAYVIVDSIWTIHNLYIAGTPT